VQHNLTILKGSSTVGSTPTFNGGSKSFSVSLKPGSYSFVCTVTGHAQAGMFGTIIVK
jgi:plastocyanin